MAAESGKIDPMHQFLIEPLFGKDWAIAGHNIAFTNSSLWMVITFALLWLFMMGGMKRELVPGRWQVMVEGFTSFIDNMIMTSIGPKGKTFTPYVFSLFMFILTAGMLGMLPLSVIGIHPFTVTSHLTITGTLAVLSFSMVLIVGFWKHGLRFFSLFVPHGTPGFMIPLIAAIEFFSFMVRPFSLGLRLFVAMSAGHILMAVLGGFVINGAHAGAFGLAVVSIPSFLLMIFIQVIELLVVAIQAYVFAILTSLYLNDAINLH